MVCKTDFRLLELCQKDYAPRNTLFDTLGKDTIVERKLRQWIEDAESTVSLLKENLMGENS